MDRTTIIEIIILFLLLILSAFFSSSETAYTTVSKIRLRALSDEGNKKADRVLKILENSNKMLSAILIGNNIVNLSASSLATSVAIRFFGSVGAGIATFILTFLVLIFGEISPKTMAKANAEKLVLRYCDLIAALMWVLTPIIFIINALAHGFLRLFGYSAEEEAPAITESDLNTIIDIGHEEGVIESDEKEIIHNLFHFSDAKAREVMIPRIDMVTISRDAGYEDLMALYRETMFTRIPVYEDSNDNIVGFINMKDILLIENTESFRMDDIMREVYFTHERKDTGLLLMELRSKNISLAIVIDEYGATAGMLTMEDLLEEIVGEIRDEYDDDEEDVIQPITDTQFRVDGITNLDFFNEKLGTHFETEDSDSIGGYAIELFEHMPEEDEEVTTEDGVTIRVESMEGNRIEKLHITLPEEESEEGEAKEENASTAQPTTE